ncbi:sodium:calcium antiporter [Candidatus Omnitrophota bacterium]
MVWLEFLLCGSLLTFFAYCLCKEGVILSEKTKIEKGVIGMIFLAIATSFPEIVTAATAVSSLGRIGLGYGDIAGSVMINLMILLAIDYYQGKGRILRRVSKVNRVTGALVFILAAFILGAILIRRAGIDMPVIGRVGMESIIIIFFYVAALNFIRDQGAPPEHEVYAKAKVPFWEIWGKFVSFLLIVMFLGMWMAKIGENIVIETGLSQTFTGTLFLGFATSLPEIIVSFAALKASSIEMAVGNILGSNLFDLSIIPFLDLLTERPILGVLSAGQSIATVFVVLLCAIAVAGLFIKKDTKNRVSWDTSLIFIVGIAGFMILYFIR